MKVAVHQPNYLPYLGFFHKMMKADVFVLYDTAQFSKNEFHNRNRIKTPSGVQWLTVPVRRAVFQPIRAVQVVASQNWAAKHLRAIEANYRRAPYYTSYASDLKSVLAKRWSLLADLNAALITLIARLLSIDTKLVQTSELPVPTTENPTKKLIHYTQACGGTVYVSGVGGRDYLDMNEFATVQLEYAAFTPSPYPQLFGRFAPNLSAIDALFNCGESTHELLT